MRAGEVVVGNRAVAIAASAIGPGVADEELVGLVIVHEGHHSVVAVVGFRELEHGNQSASCGDGCLEALVDGDAEDEGDARNQAGLERPDVCVIRVGGISETEFVGLDEALLGGNVGKAPRVVRPEALRTDSEFFGDAALSWRLAPRSCSMVPSWVRSFQHKNNREAMTGFCLVRLRATWMAAAMALAVQLPNLPQS